MPRGWVILYTWVRRVWGEIRPNALIPWLAESALCRGHRRRWGPRADGKRLLGSGLRLQLSWEQGSPT